MTTALLDDHLLRDLLADEAGDSLSAALATHEPATTNLYLYRLSKSVVSASGGRLTGSWPLEQRRQLGRTLMTLPPTVEIVPLRDLTFRMAEISHAHPLSALGAEAIAAAEHLAASLCVWEGDDGPRIRSAANALGIPYAALTR